MDTNMNNEEEVKKTEELTNSENTDNTSNHETSEEEHPETKNVLEMDEEPGEVDQA